MEQSQNRERLEFSQLEKTLFRLLSRVLIVNNIAAPSEDTNRLLALEVELREHLILHKQMAKALRGLHKIDSTPDAYGHEKKSSLQRSATAQMPYAHVKSLPLSDNEFTKLSIGLDEVGSHINSVSAKKIAFVQSLSSDDLGRIISELREYVAFINAHAFESRRSISLPIPDDEFLVH